MAHENHVDMKYRHSSAHSGCYFSVSSISAKLMISFRCFLQEVLLKDQFFQLKASLVTTKHSLTFNIMGEHTVTCMQYIGQQRIISTNEIGIHK